MFSFMMFKLIWHFRNVLKSYAYLDGEAWRWLTTDETVMKFWSEDRKTFSNSQAESFIQINMHRCNIHAQMQHPLVKLEISVAVQLNKEHSYQKYGKFLTNVFYPLWAGKNIKDI